MTVESAEEFMECLITPFFESSICVHSVIETEYKEGKFGYEFSQNIGWLVGETTNWVEGGNTGALTKEEYDELINDLIEADKNGTYLYSKPYYIYKWIKIAKQVLL